jgi:hypothetical protein
MSDLNLARRAVACKRYRLTLTPDGLATPLSEWLRRCLVAWGVQKDDYHDGSPSAAIDALLCGRADMDVDADEADFVRGHFDGLVRIEKVER